MAGKDDLMLGWAAGLFEGEGCIGHNKVQDQWQLLLSSTDHDVVATFHRVVGVGTVRALKPPANPNHKQVWKWRASGRADVLELLLRLRPLLHARRGERADEAIASLQARVTGRHYHSDTCPNGHLRVVGARRCVPCQKAASARAYSRKVAG